ncbi:MAG: hypothetical protein SAJ37_05685, partial [Oscillatoria sp. PMC 1068.18]|nr:hypothetical protein [Oscillatoria sp. PMC 1068.18]
KLSRSPTLAQSQPNSAQLITFCERYLTFWQFCEANFWFSENCGDRLHSKKQNFSVRQKNKFM